MEWLVTLLREQGSATIVRLSMTPGPANVLEVSIIPVAVHVYSKITSNSWWRVSQMAHSVSVRYLARGQVRCNSPCASDAYARVGVDVWDLCHKYILYLYLYLWAGPGGIHARHPRSFVAGKEESS